MAWGRLSETRLGRRGAVSAAALLGVVLIPIYLYVSEPWILCVGAFLLGCTGAGIFGMAPSYLTERFPTEARGAGAGFAYHAGAALGSIAPTVLGSLQVAGWSLQNAMASGIAIAGLMVASVIWLGPETRAQKFTVDR